MNFMAVVIVIALVMLAIIIVELAAMIPHDRIKMPDTKEILLDISAQKRTEKIYADLATRERKQIAFEATEDARRINAELQWKLEKLQREAQARKSATVTSADTDGDHPWSYVRGIVLGCQQEIAADTISRSVLLDKIGEWLEAHPK